jgi:hypothetical protein
VDCDEEAFSFGASATRDDRMSAAPGLVSFAEVMAGVNGCAPPDPAGGASSLAALQGQVNYLFETFGGGKLQIPAGNFDVTGGLAVPGLVTIEGLGRGITILSTKTDTPSLVFQTSNQHGGARHLSVWGCRNSDAGSNAINVMANASPTLEDIDGFFGYAGLFTAGIDGHYTRCHFYGNVNSVTSVGANWYQECSLDTPDKIQRAAAFVKGAPPAGATSAEDRFMMCDTSGAFDLSLDVQDTTGQAIIDFIGGNLPCGVRISGGAWIKLTDIDVLGGIQVLSPVVPIGLSGCVKQGELLDLSAHANVTGDTNCVNIKLAG